MLKKYAFLLFFVCVSTQRIIQSDDAATGLMSNGSQLLKNTLIDNGYFVVCDLEPEEKAWFVDCCNKVALENQPEVFWVKSVGLNPTILGHAKSLYVVHLDSSRGVVCLDVASRWSFIKRKPEQMFALYRELGKIKYQYFGFANPALEKRLDLEAFKCMHCASCVKKSVIRFWKTFWTEFAKADWEKEPIKRVCQEINEFVTYLCIPQGAIWADKLFVQNYIQAHCFEKKCSCCKPSKEEKRDRALIIKTIKQRNKIQKLEFKRKRKK